MSEILQPNKPFKYASRNPRTHYKRLKSGEIFLLEVEIDEEVWNQVRTLPENALMENITWHHDGDNAEAISEEPAKKEPKGEHSFYWQELFKRGFQNYPDLIEVCGCAGDQIRLRLHDVFGVTSLTFVAPAQFEDWLASEGLHSLITLSRQAQAKLRDAA